MGNKVKITFLGTNGWYDSKTGNTVCTLIETKDYYLVFEAGDGIQKLDEYIKKDKPIYLFISHFHIDHVSGLHILPKFRFKNPITICIGNGRKKDFLKLVNKPYMIPINHKFIKQKIKLHELKYGKNKIPFEVNCQMLNHMWSSIGLRISLDGKVITHCMDTGICKNAELLSKNADVMIFECSLLTNQSVGKWGHPTPEEVLELAKKSKAKVLILSHFAADRYKTLKQRMEILKKANMIFKNTIVAVDGKSVIL